MPIEEVTTIIHRERTEYEKKLDVLKAVITNCPIADLLNQLCVTTLQAEEFARKYNAYLATAHKDYISRVERDYYAANEMIRRIEEEIIRRCGQ